MLFSEGSTEVVVPAVLAHLYDYDKANLIGKNSSFGKAQILFTSVV